MLGEVPKLFGRGFVLGYLFPAAIFFAYLTYGLKIDLLLLGSWKTVTLEQLGRASLAIVSIGLLLMLLNRLFVRILEGYSWANPLRLLGWLTRRRYARHASPVWEEWKELEQAWRDNNDADPPKGFADRAIRAAAGFPDKESLLLPTRFGNAYRAYECYPRIIYGMDVIALWSRLLHVVPAGGMEQLRESRAKLDFQVNLFWLSVFTILAGFQAPAGWSWFAALPPAVLATIVWLLLPSAARGWGKGFAAIFDLYRAPLAKGLGLELPSTLDEERTMWTEVSRTILYRRALTADYLDRFRVGRTSGSEKTEKFEKLADLLYVKKSPDEPPATSEAE